MLNYKKPKKKLGLFLKDNKNSFAKSKLAKIGLATGAAIISMNLMCDNAVLAQHNNLDNMTAAWQRVAGTYCYQLVSTHINHNQHSSHSSHSSY